MCNPNSQIIFLISQPRSGSTLLQRMLGAHPEIYTHSESWIMLHPLFPMKYEDLVTPYNPWLYSLGLQDFISGLPRGKIQYQEELANTFLSFYYSILKHNNKSIFIDKTPRYFHIIPELLVSFPEAKFIILLRNPAAVILSIINTFTKEDWNRLSDFRHDLLFAPQKILDGITAAGQKSYRLGYESLIDEPEKELSGVCNFLGINFSHDLICYNDTKLPKWRFGDQHNVYLQEKPNKAFKDNWVKHLKEPQSWRIVKEYLEMLGKELVLAMGYDFDAIMKKIESNKPSTESYKTLGLEEIFANSADLAIENSRLKKRLRDLDGKIQHMDKIIKRHKSNSKTNEQNTKMSS